MGSNEGILGRFDGSDDGVSLVHGCEIIDEVFTEISKEECSVLVTIPVMVVDEKIMKGFMNLSLKRDFG